MTDPQVVVFTANDRHAYMRKVLRSWQACPGIAGARMIFLCEPGHPSMAAECAAACLFCGSVDIRVNPRKYGVLSNPWQAFEAGFQHADYVIVAEDDTVVSADALAFFAAADDLFASDEQVLAVSPFRHHAPPGATPGGVELTTAFESTIWATWADRWARTLRDTWDHDYSDDGFDWNIQAITDRQGFRIVQPQLSRAQHIGKYEGTHMLPHDHEALQSTCFDPGSRTAVFRFAGERDDVRPARESIK